MLGIDVGEVEAEESEESSETENEETQTETDITPPVFDKIPLCDNVEVDFDEQYSSNDIYECVLPMF